MNDDPLLLRNQICFPLYACSRKITGEYRPFLEPLDLTYTQYIAMMVLWEHDGLSIKALGGILRLDSGTLSPMLKELERKGYVTRTRSEDDERVLTVSLTESGRDLRKRAEDIPARMGACIPLDEEETATLYRLLYRILDS